MTPAQEVLCSAIEAWGARYSDSPIVLGLSPEKAKMAPKGKYPYHCHGPNPLTSNPKSFRLMVL